MHDDQLELDAETAEALIRDQFPQWAALPVRVVQSAGTVNALFRIGDELAARFPLRGSDPDVVRVGIEREADAAAAIYGCTRFPTPRPVAIGQPGGGYPLPWSVQTWIAGEDGFIADPSASAPFADDLADFVLAVRTMDTGGRTFAGTGRGGDVAAHDDWVQECLANSAGLFDVEAVSRLWNALRELPRTSSDVMTHGDLIPGNVLVADGRLTGVIDVGGLGPADPALDLVGAWHLLDDAPRARFLARLGSDDLEWRRGMAWALEEALGAAWYYANTNPQMHRMGMRTITRILDAEH